MNNSAQLQSIVQSLQNSGPNMDPQRKKDTIQKVISMYADSDVDYLNALYFPESSDSARIPSKFGVPSAVFSQKFHYYVNTGDTGSGVIGLLPQDTTFRCAFRQNGTQGSYGNGVLVQGAFFQPQSNCDYIPDKFSEARLVGASQRVSYIGTAEQESGFLVGSHLFDANPFMVSEEQIEEGHYVSRARPSQGVRLVYLPKDERDMFFSPTNIKLVVAAGHNEFEFQPNDFMSHTGAQDADMGDDAQEDGLRVQSKVLLSDDASSNLQWGQVLTKQAPMYYLGQHSDKGDSQTPNMMVVYYKGLPKNQDWLRVDVERHFEAIPRHALKDFVGVKRPVHNQKTIDFVQTATHTTNLHSQTGEMSEELVKYVKPNIHLLPDNTHLVQGEPTVDHFAQFASMAGSLAGMAGAAYMGQPELMSIAATAGSTLGAGLYQKAVTY